MSHNKNSILEYDIDEDNCTSVLDDSDVDEIVEEMKLMCNNESDEYR